MHKVIAYHKSVKIIQKNVYAQTDNLPAKSPFLQEPTRRHLPKIGCLTDFLRMLLKNTYSAVTTFCWKASSQKQIDFQSYARSLLVFGKTELSLLTEKGAMYRLTCLIKQYEKYQRKPTGEFEAEMSKIFDITKSDGEWLCKEDKKLFENQAKSNGSIGYVTKKASSSTIYYSETILLKNFLMKAVNLQQQELQAMKAVTRQVPQI